MATIILKDKSEYQISAEKAQEMFSLWNNQKSKGQKIIIGDVAIDIGSIFKVVFDAQEKPDPFAERLKTMHNERRAFLKLTPREKAQQYSWGHFKFFFQGVYGKPPKDELKEKVINAAEVFYRKNPFIDRPLMLLWQKVLKIEEGKPMNKMHYHVLSMQDSMAYQIIREDAEFEAKRLGIELVVPEVAI